MSEQLYKRILLPTDGSKYADKSLKHALALAEANGAEIIALSVAENTFPVNLSGQETISEIHDLMQQESLANLKKVVDAVEKQALDVKVTTMVVQGSPAKVILNTIEEEDIDLVVMGSSGKSGIDIFFMGSVAEKVVRSAKCSVLVVH